MYYIYLSAHRAFMLMICSLEISKIIIVCSYLLLFSLHPSTVNLFFRKLYGISEHRHFSNRSFFRKLYGVSEHRHFSNRSLSTSCLNLLRSKKIIIWYTNNISGCCTIITANIRRSHVVLSTEWTTSISPAKLTHHNALNERLWRWYVHWSYTCSSIFKADAKTFLI